MTHEPDGYCEDCGLPVIDGINGDVDREYGIVVCAACQEDGWRMDVEEIHASIDALHERRGWESAVVDDMPAAGMF